MKKDEIIEELLTDKWWPFDRVDPKILEELMQKEKQQKINEIGEALL
jgi:hypothetical protein